MKAAHSKLKAAKKSTAAKPDPKHFGVMIAIGPAPHGMHGMSAQDDKEDGEPSHVDGGKAKPRLDRPARKAYAGGGHVRGPSPSLREAANGIDVDHPAYRPSMPDNPDAPDVTQAKRMLQSPESSRLSDDEIKAIGDYIISRQRVPQIERKDGGRVSFAGGAGSGVGRMEKSEHAERKARR